MKQASLKSMHMCGILKSHPSFNIEIKISSLICEEYFFTKSLVGCILPQGYECLNAMV